MYFKELFDLREPDVVVRNLSTINIKTDFSFYTNNNCTEGCIKIGWHGRHSWFV